MNLRTLLPASLLLIGGGGLQAGVIFSGLQNIAIPTNPEGVYLDVDNAATSTSPFTGWDLNFFFGGFGIANSAAFQPDRTSTANDAPVLRLNAGDLIGPAGLRATGEAGSDAHIGPASNQFQAGQDGYLGFMFTKNDSSGPFYGWMRLALTVNQPGGVIEEWAYDNTGAPIAAAAPEPGKSMLLCAGMAALTMNYLRRRRDGNLG